MVLALEMQSVAVGWQIYEITHARWISATSAWRNFCRGFCFFWFPAMLSTNSIAAAILVLCYCGYPLCSTLLLIGGAAGRQISRIDLLHFGFYRRGSII